MRTFTRRAVLAVSGGTAITVLAGATAVGSSVGTPAPLHRSRFVRLVGTRFRLESDGGRSVARLVAVHDLPGGAVGDDRAYSLLFRPLAGAQPEAGIQLLRAPGLESVALFLVPVDRGSTLRLQAVINQRVPR